MSDLEKVDPVLLKARDLVATRHFGDIRAADATLRGDDDKSNAVQHAVKAIRAGMAMTTGDDTMTNTRKGKTTATFEYIRAHPKTQPKTLAKIFGLSETTATSYKQIALVGGHERLVDYKRAVHGRSRVKDRPQGELLLDAPYHPPPEATLEVNPTYATTSIVAPVVWPTAPEPAPAPARAEDAWPYGPVPEDLLPFAAHTACLANRLPRRDFAGWLRGEATINQWSNEYLRLARLISDE
jgi:hypothetical protein